MASKREREEFGNFVAQLSACGVQHPTDVALELSAMARRHHRLQEHHCNGDCAACGEAAGWLEECPRERRLEERIEALCKANGLGVRLSGDPRGCTVKVLLPSGAFNTWGGEEHGWGVPA